MIPLEKSTAVTSALRQAFGVTAYEDIRRMERGLSTALTFRIVVRESPYLLKVITHINEMNDPTRQFAHMRAAADAGLAPRVWYTSTEDGVCITDFVETTPFSVTEAILQIPRVLRTLHALPPFRQEMNYVTMHKGFVWRFRAANLLPKDETEEIFARYAQVAAVYPRLDSDMVSCHNDLKPENILFDGRHVWLADWEASLLNDRYFDLAIVANFIVNEETEERIFLQEYFGQPPDEYQRARFFLMRQVMHLLYASVFLLLGSSGKSEKQRGRALDFKDFHRRIWMGEIHLSDDEMKVAYGRIHWDQLLRNVRQPRFDESLKVVSDRNPSAQEMRRLLPVAQAENTRTIFDAAGGLNGLHRLAAAWHRRVMADAVVSHAFSHGFDAGHVERLAAYWAEALGGPAAYSGSYGDETRVVKIHSGNGEHEEMDRRAISCFDQALADTGLDRDHALRQALHDYFAWATNTTMSRYHKSAQDVPDGLSIPRWSWGGLQP